MVQAAQFCEGVLTSSTCASRAPVQHAAQLYEACNNILVALPPQRAVRSRPMAEHGRQRSAAAKAAALAFTAYWYRECVRPLLYQPHYLALSFAIVPVVRWHHRRGGFASYAGTITADAPSLAAVVKQELRNVAADWTAPLLCCARAHTLPLNRTYVDLFAAASALPSYASVGPLGLSRVIRGRLSYPVTQIGEIQHTLAIFSRWRGGALLCADALVLR